MTTAAMATYAYDQIDQAERNSNTLVELRESSVQRGSGARHAPILQPRRRRMRRQPRPCPSSPT